MGHTQAAKSFLGWNRLIVVHFLLGILAGLFLPAGLADMALGRTLLGVFPALGALSSHSADAAVWGSYCVLMLLLTAAFTPMVAILLYRESRPPGDSRALWWSLFLALLFAGFIYWMLVGSAGFWTEDSFQGRTKGAVLGRFLLNHRFGLALVGSLFMSLMLFFAALLAVLPLLPFKSTSLRD